MDQEKGEFYIRDPPLFILRVEENLHRIAAELHSHKIWRANVEEGVLNAKSFCGELLLLVSFSLAPMISIIGLYHCISIVSLILI